MSPFFKKVSIGILALFFIFLAREAWLGRVQLPVLVGDKNILLVRIFRGTLVEFGDTDSSRTKTLEYALRPYFSSSTVAIDKQVGASSFSGKGFSLQIFTPNFARLDMGGAGILFLGDDFLDEDLLMAKSQQTSLESDFWVMKKNKLSEKIPAPKHGVLFVGDRAPSNKTKSWAQTKNIPIISVSQTGGFSISQKISGNWEIFTRQSD